MIFSIAMVKDLIENQRYYVSSSHMDSNSPNPTLIFTLVGHQKLELDTDDPEIIAYVMSKRE